MSDCRFSLMGCHTLKCRADGLRKDHEGRRKAGEGFRADRVGAVDVDMAGRAHAAPWAPGTGPDART